jgi:outer membrane protein TolC
MKIKFLAFLLLFLTFIPAGMSFGEPEKTPSKTYSLQECARLSIENSFKIKTYDYKLDYNQQKVKEILSNNNPQASITGLSTYQKPEVAFTLPLFPPIKAVIQPEWYHNYNINVTKLITSFGKVEASAKLTEINNETILDQKQIEDESTLLSAARGFYGLLLAQEILSIAEAQVKTWEEQYRISESQYKRGVVARYDLLRVEVSLKTAQDQRETAVKNLDVARGNLRTVMGLPFEERISSLEKSSPWGEGEKEKYEATLLKWRDRGREKNPSMKIARVACRQSALALDLALLDMAPSLSFQTSYGRLTQSFGAADWAWKNTVQLALPLVDGGEKKSKIAQAKDLIQQADLTLSDTERTVLWNVESAYLELHDINPKLKTAEEQLALAEEGYRVASVRYREGLNTIVELVDAQTQRLRSQVNREQVLYSYYTQMAALSFAAGTLREDIFSSTGEKQ